MCPTPLSGPASGAPRSTTPRSGVPVSGVPVSVPRSGAVRSWAPPSGGPPPSGDVVELHAASRSAASGAKRSEARITRVYDRAWRYVMSGRVALVVALLFVAACGDSSTTDGGMDASRDGAPRDMPGYDGFEDFAVPHD